jgi:hypothetical protein
MLYFGYPLGIHGWKPKPETEPDKFRVSKPKNHGQKIKPEPETARPETRGYPPESVPLPSLLWSHKVELVDIFALGTLDYSQITLSCPLFFLLYFNTAVHGPRACWHFLAQSLGLMFPNNGTRNAVTIFLNTCRNTPQAYGYIIVAFYPEVFGYRSFIFSQRKAWYKSL